MAFKYSCFISYPGGKYREMRDFVFGLKRELENKIDPWLDEDVFIDAERLKGGDLYNERLGRALCESICMILVFTPKYFSKRHIFCSREYKAMEELEKERMERLGLKRDNRYGFIIPIVYRGKKYLPAEIMGKRHVYDFSAPDLDISRMDRDKRCYTAIQEIAERIYDLSLLVDQSNIDLCDNCDQFKLPTERDIEEWMKNLKVAPAPFPDSEED